MMQINIENDMYKKILDLLDVGIHVINETGKTTIYNKKMMEIEGTEIEDVLDKNILEVFQFYQGEASTLLKVLHTGRAILNTHQTYFNHKGHEIKTVNNTYPLTFNNQIVGAVEIVRDVTYLDRMMKKSIQRKQIGSTTFESLSDKQFYPHKVLETGQKVATTSSSIFIIGEAGTGKRTLTECIHHEVNQDSKPYFIHNCTSLLDNYVEQAILESIHQLENADGGTLVIEDIQNFSPTSQLKLLNFLNNARNYKIICTTNEDPIDLIAKGQLNKKFYYLLSELTIFIPPIRERKNSIQELALFFIEKYNRIYQVNLKTVSEEVFQAFIDYDWPGNLRELDHIIERSMKIIDSEDTLLFQHLPMKFKNRISQDHQFLINKNQEIKPLEEYMQEAEKYYIQKGLQYHKFNITKTAQTLKMSRQNLQYRMRKYGIKKP